MQEPTVQPEQTAIPPEVTGDPNAEGAGNEAVATEALLNELLQMRAPNGATPGVTDEASDIERQILENQFRQDTRLMMSDVREMIEEVSPNATRGDIQAFTRAFVKGDPMEMWKVAMNSTRKQTEKESNSKELKDLRVEGGNSGTKGTEKTPIRTTSEAALRLADAFSK